MNVFMNFVHCYGSPTNHLSMNGDEVTKYQNILPLKLLNFWRHQGFGSYADGLFWTHPPSMFSALTEEWTSFSPDQAGLIFRSSFGDFCIWNRGRAYLLNVQFGKVEELTRDIDFLFNYILPRKQFLKAVLQSELHFQCVELLGQLRVDECFAFIPAKALGGPGTIETVQRVTIQEHLALLAQLVGPISI